MRRLKLTFLLLGAILAAGAQTPVQYIVQLQSEPVLRAHDKTAAGIAVRREQDSMVASLESHGFQVVRRLQLVGNLVIVQGPANSLPTLQSLAGVKRAFLSHKRKPHFDASIPLHQIDSAWKAIAGNTYNPSGNPTGWNAAGAGVKIGLIDTGIDPNHPAFSTNVSGHMSNPTTGGPWPKYSSTGNNQALWTQYPGIKGKVIVLRTYDGTQAYDFVGHGTAVAQVAAGVPITNPVVGTLSGVAPAAWIGIYDINSMNTEISYTDATILQAVDDAASDGMNVLNMSFGGSDFAGMNDPANQVYAEELETLAQAGILVICSAGNDGPYADTMNSPGVLDGVVTVGAQQSTTADGNPGVSSSDGTAIVAAESDTVSYFQLPVTAPLVNVTQWDSTGTGCSSTAWPKSGVASGKILVVERSPSITNCYFSTKFQNAITAGAVGIIVYNDPGETDPDELVSPELDTATSAVQAFPGLFIGNTDAQTLLAKMAANSNYTVTLSFGFNAGDPREVAGFSSRGPDADLNIKPDLIAVGNSLIAAVCTETTLYQGDNQCDATGYEIWDGTSFSSPLTTGSAAVLMAARPGLAVSDYRSLLVNTTSPMTDPSGRPWPVQVAGAGSLNLLAGLQGGVTVTPSTVSFGSAAAQTPKLQQTLTLKNVGTAPASYNLAISSNSAAEPTLSTSTLSLAAGATQTVTVNAPAGTLAAGTYEGFITVTPSGASSAAARVPYWYAVPAKGPTHMVADTSEGLPVVLTLSQSQGAETSSVYLRFVDDSGVTFPAPGKVSIYLLNYSNSYDVPSYATPYPAYDTSVSGASIVSYPDVWEIDITPAASVYAQSGDTATFRVICGDLTFDFEAIVQVTN
jgi:hypothetical protein